AAPGSDRLGATDPSSPALPELDRVSARYAAGGPAGLDQPVRTSESGGQSNATTAQDLFEAGVARGASAGGARGAGSGGRPVLAGVMTVHRDLASTDPPGSVPDRSVGLDAKSYPAERPKLNPWRRPSEPDPRAANLELARRTVFRGMPGDPVVEEEPLIGRSF